MKRKVSIFGVVLIVIGVVVSLACVLGYDSLYNKVNIYIIGLLFGAFPIMAGVHSIRRTTKNRETLESESVVEEPIINASSANEEPARTETEHKLQEKVQNNFSIDTDAELSKDSEKSNSAKEDGNHYTITEETERETEYLVEEAKADIMPADDYEIGDTGPAGGTIFYIKEGNRGVWQYLEVAPNNIPGSYSFGYYRPDGMTDSTVGTKSQTGAGKANTNKLVEAMGNETYIEENGDKKGIYAAKACLDYSLNGFNDWFLPSINELKQIYRNIIAKDEMNYFDDSYFWSSTEDGAGWGEMMNISDGEVFEDYRWSDAAVLPIRAF